MYAIVDIETTGSFSSQNRIIEIAVVFHDGEKITGHYETLLDPGRNIPGFITGLTGIDAEMLVGAPSFSEISGDLLEMLKGKVFVAHNVGFDFSFVKDAFEREGISYKPKRLCTVRLSRKIFPGHRSYSLGRICEAKGIVVNDRHRALGDAWATALLFGKLITSDQEGHVRKALTNRNKELTLPPHISFKTFQELPQATGIYYFHDKNGQVIYVGKAINIQNRFTGHFTGKSKINLKSEIYDVSFELTGSELLALMMEVMEIKRLWPKYNRSMKNKSVSWGIFLYEDRQGYLRFQVNKSITGLKPLFTFNNHSDAWHFLTEKVLAFNLCPKLSGIQKAPGACYDHQFEKCAGACCGKESSMAYNLKVETCLKKVRLLDSKVLIRDLGRTQDEETVMYFENGFLSAFGFIDKTLTTAGKYEILDYLKPVKQVAETSYLLNAYLDKIPKKNIQFLNRGDF